MDLQLFLLTTTVGFAVVVALTALMYRPLPKFGILLNLGILAAAGLAWLIIPDKAGGIAFVAWVVLFLIPALTTRAISRRAYTGDWASASRLSRMVARLVPLASLRHRAQFYDAMALPPGPVRDNALSGLRGKLSAASADALEQALLLGHRDWQGLIDRAQQGRNLDPTYVVRAFGELGRLNDMARCYRATQDRIPAISRPITWLILFAFTGRVEALESVLSGRMANQPADTKNFWRAVAIEASGDRHTSREMFHVLAENASSETLRQIAGDRLALAAVAETLTAETLAILADVEEMARQDYPLATHRWWHGPLTYLIILANLIVFAIEVWLGGSESGKVLYRLGALWPETVLRDGEWWRLGTALFLHAGPLHLAANMLSLWLLGRYVERLYGWLDLLIVYGIGGLASMAAVLWLIDAGYVDEALLVGASGAIFAVVGAITIWRILAWWHSRTLANRRALAGIVIVLAVQVMIDLSIPQVSLSAHISGFIAGMGLAGLARLLAIRRLRHAVPTLSRFLARD